MLNNKENNAPANRPSVLHIDDDEFALQLFALKYKNWFNIASAIDSNTVFELLDQKHFDVIITDYDMPETDGLKLLQIINEKYPGIPVIFFTGQGNEKIAREAFLLGAFDYFVKDFQAFAQTEKLIYAVKRALDSKKSAQALLEKDLRYIELLEFVPHIAIFTDSSGKIKHANKHFESITGNTRDKFIDIRIEELFGEEDKPKINELLETAVRRGLSTATDIRMKTEAGRLDSMNLIVRNNSTTQEEAELLFIIQQKEKSTETDAEEEQSKPNQEPIKVGQTDKEGNVHLKPEKIQDITSHDNDSPGKTAFRISIVYAIVGCLWILTSDGILGLMVHDRHTITTISAFKGWFYVGITAWLLYLLINNNVKKIFETKDTLAKAEAANRAILNFIPDPILKISGEGIILDVRDGNLLDKITNSTDIKGKSLSEAIPQLYRAGSESIKRILTNGESESIEFKVNNAGRMTVFEARAIPGINNEILIIIREITLRREMENRILEQNRSLTEFAGLITNRLKTPIGIIGGFTSIIREQRDLFDKYYDAIVSEVERINDMMSSLLKLSSRDSLKDKKTSIHFRDVLSSVMSEVAGEDFMLKVISEDMKPVINAEPDGFRQALIGIISFAHSHRKNREEDFALEASFIQTSGCQSLVMDFETSGLTSEYLQKLFDPSFSIKKGEMEFGLVLARSAVEIQGGRLDIKLDEATGRLTVDIAFEGKDIR